MKKGIGFVIVVTLLGGCILLGAGLVIMVVSQPCGWVDSYMRYTGCTRQLEIGGIGRGTFNSNLTMFASETSNGMRIWRISDGSMAGEVPGQVSVFGPNDTFFVGSTETISVWRTQNWALQSTLNIPLDMNIAEIAIAPDMSSLAVVFRDDSSPKWQLQLWQTIGGVLLHRLEGHKDYITSVAYSLDGTLLASGSYDNSIRLWRVEDGRLLHTLKGHQDHVEKVVFAPDGKTLASSSWDGTIRVWQTDDGMLLFTLKGDNRIAFDIAYSPDGSLLASAGTAGLVQLWDVNNGTLIRNLRQNWRGLDIDALAFSPDGKVLATAERNGPVRLYNVQQLLNTAKK